MTDRRRRFVLDTSGAAQLRGGRLARGTLATFMRLAEDERVFTSSVVLLELGRLARSTAEHRDLMDGLLPLAIAPLDRFVEHRALEAQARLADRGQHQIPVPDLLLAALAERHDLDVLHHDGHFDTLAEHSGLRFGSVWLERLDDAA